jgi:hypothetical protein
LRRSRLWSACAQRRFLGISNQQRELLESGDHSPHSKAANGAERIAA